jgi:uncharacterized protein with HEPN domain
VSRSDLERLEDALDHCQHALVTAGRHPVAALGADRNQLQSLLYDLAVIGTTVGQLSSEVRGLEPTLPWRAIVDTRNRIIHAYWQIDLAILAGVVERDLPAPENALDRLIETVEQSGL